MTHAACHRADTPASQTRAPLTGSVSAEGGGTTTPTQEGGGLVFSRDSYRLLARRPLAASSRAAR